jgi:hypothetical protein
VRFTSYFEPEFLEKEHISLVNVVVNEKNKTFQIQLKGDKLIDVQVFKKLVLGMQNLSLIKTPLSDGVIPPWRLTQTLMLIGLWKTAERWIGRTDLEVIPGHGVSDPLSASIREGNGYWVILLNTMKIFSSA